MLTAAVSTPFSFWTQRSLEHQKVADEQLNTQTAEYVAASGEVWTKLNTYEQRLADDAPATRRYAARLLAE